MFFILPTGITLAGTTAVPAGWIYAPSCTGASCSGGMAGGVGYYFDGTANNSCCLGAVVGDGIPNNNFGDQLQDCAQAGFAISFNIKIKNSILSSTLLNIKLRGVADGNTGCWSTPDALNNTISFQLAALSCNPVLCNPVGTTTLVDRLSGNSYQWQMSTDSINFNNISNNSNYSGAISFTLGLSGIPSSWYGYQYRRLTNGTAGQVFTLIFANTWTGAVNSDWNNPGNWSCNAVPDTYTDAIVNSGPVNVTADCSVRSVHVGAGVVFTVNPGISFTVIH